MQAVKEGLENEFISALKMLSGENFANLSPSPRLVKLSYTHPTLDARISAIRKAMEK